MWVWNATDSLLLRCKQSKKSVVIDWVFCPLRYWEIANNVLFKDGNTGYFDRLSCMDKLGQGSSSFSNNSINISDTKAGEVVVWGLSCSFKGLCYKHTPFVQSSLRRSSGTRLVDILYLVREARWQKTEGIPQHQKRDLSVTDDGCLLQCSPLSLLFTAVAQSSLFHCNIIQVFAALAFSCVCHP
jgi:hypothetical protein